MFGELGKNPSPRWDMKKGNIKEIKVSQPDKKTDRNTCIFLYSMVFLAH